MSDDECGEENLRKIAAIAANIRKSLEKLDTPHLILMSFYISKRLKEKLLSGELGEFE
jgi:hypothetical protein